MHRNRDQHLERIQFLYEAGYRCVAFDFRAHGDSSGNLISFGYHEAGDVAAILDLAKSRWPAQPLTALGISMGAAALCYAVEKTRHLDAVILECLYRDIASTFARRLDSAFFPPSYRLLAPGVIWLTEWRMGVGQEKLVPLAHVSQFAPTPVLVLTGSEDRYAPPEDTHSLYEELGEPRESWIVPGAGHGDLCEKGAAEYRERVLTFLHRWTAQQDTPDPIG
jgi:alpha-beta hydrolase superfamily lysophospholipase